VLLSRKEADSDQTSRYKTLHEIGRGGMGVVYLAEDIVLQRKVALKILYPALSSDEEFIERFHQEARLVSGVADPHVVHINNLAMVEHRLAIDMEYVDGLPLNQFIAQEFVTSAVVLRIARDMLLGLSACHYHGLVHCDIKPSNVLLPTRGPAKLADFGLARAYSGCLETPMRDKSTTGLLFGTPIYSPPELWDGAKPSPASDLFSVGVVLYETLSGQVPYSGPTPLAVIKSMLTAPLPPLSERAPSLSPQLCALVQRLLASDPDARPGSADEVLRELGQLPEYVPEDGDTQTIGIPRRPFRARHKLAGRSRILVGGLVVLLAVLGITAFVFSGNWPPTIDDHRDSVAAPEPLEKKDAGNDVKEVAIRQTDLLAKGLPSKQELLASWKDASPATCRVFDASALDDNYPDFSRWLVLSENDTDFNHVIGYSDSGLLEMRRISETSEDVVLDGTWADYRNRAGSWFREGAVSGRGQWLPGRSGLAVLLNFSDITDNSTWSSVVKVQPSSQPQTDTRFFYDLEARDAVLPLLYNELLPRRRAWAAELEPHLSCLVSASVRSPLLPDMPAITVDGLLDEPLWTSKYFDAKGIRMGALPARPVGNGAEMLIRAWPSTVCIGIRTPAAGADSHRLRLALLPLVRIPASQSPAYVVDIDETGAIVDSRLLIGGGEKAWIPDWNVGASLNDGTWSVEIVIPAARANTDVRQNTIWRLNCEVVRQVNNEGQPMFQWGFPDTEDALHGILAEFGAPLEIQPTS